MSDSNYKYEDPDFEPRPQLRGSVIGVFVGLWLWAVILAAAWGIGELMRCDERGAVKRRGIRMTTKVVRFAMPNGSRWEVPVIELLRLRAANYASDFGGDIEKSLQSDSLPLFEEDEEAALDWAWNNLDWLQVRPFARELRHVSPLTRWDALSGWLAAQCLGKTVEPERARRGERE